MQCNIKLWSPLVLLCGPCGTYDAWGHSSSSQAVAVYAAQFWSLALLDVVVWREEAEDCQPTWLCWHSVASKYICCISRCWCTGKGHAYRTASHFCAFYFACCLPCHACCVQYVHWYICIQFAMSCNLEGGTVSWKKLDVVTPCTVAVL